MLLLMLRNARSFLSPKGVNLLGEQTEGSPLQLIQDEYVTQVLVDEATDFSAVQLACMLELAHPAFRSFFACGDVRQRVTTWGVRSLTELAWISPDFEVRRVEFGYRQSRRLTNLATMIAGLDGSEVPTMRMPEYIDEADVPAMLGENLCGGELAGWLCNRICEIERNLTRIPSIAIFMDGDERVDPLLDFLRPLLAEHNLDIVGCKEGRIVGMESQIRIFDVQYIKGLEFEAVFFVGVDTLATHRPGEFAQYLYVGTTRAATYLGVTCEGCLPVRPEPLRSQFVTDTWDRGHTSATEA